MVNRRDAQLNPASQGRLFRHLTGQAELAEGSARCLKSWLGVSFCWGPKRKNWSTAFQQKKPARPPSPSSLLARLNRGPLWGVSLRRHRGGLLFLPRKRGNPPWRFTSVRCARHWFPGFEFRVADVWCPTPGSTKQSHWSRLSAPSLLRKDFL